MSDLVVWVVVFIVGVSTVATVSVDAPMALRRYMDRSFRRFLVAIAAARGRGGSRIVSRMSFSFSGVFRSRFALARGRAWRKSRQRRNCSSRMMIGRTVGPSTVDAAGVGAIGGIGHAACDGTSEDGFWEVYGFNLPFKSPCR